MFYLQCSIQIIYYFIVFFYMKKRVVTLRRSKSGGLGFSIKGGSEHRLPILISRISCVSEPTGQLLVGDAIYKVNDYSLKGCSHDEALDILKSAEGPFVTLTVKHYSEAATYLKSCLKKRIQIAFDENQETKWVDFITFPLLTANIRRITSLTQEIDFAFEVRGHDRMAVIQCEDERNMCGWVKLIAGNIAELTNQQVKAFNNNLSSGERFLWMGWVEEAHQLENSSNLIWRSKYLIIKGEDIYMLASPPPHAIVKMWTHVEFAFKVYQTALNVIKERSENLHRSHCFIFQTSSGKAYTLSVELPLSLIRLEGAWHRAIYESVTNLSSKTFSVTVEQRTTALTLDWNIGFAMYDPDAKSYLWQYRFSQLKCSSDDGKTRLKLHFLPEESDDIETRELESNHLPDLLYCMHAFLTAKVVSVDPNFVF
ncbi:hypothetical protein CHUAL_007609 [Chamberlinius hualienensis]